MCGPGDRAGGRLGRTSTIYIVRLKEMFPPMKLTSRSHRTTTKLSFIDPPKAPTVPTTTLPKSPTTPVSAQARCKAALSRSSPPLLKLTDDEGFVSTPLGDDQGDVDEHHG